MTTRVLTQYLSVRIATVVLFTLLAVLSHPSSALGVEPKLELASLPDGDATDVELEVPGTGQPAAVVVFVRQTGDKELPVVRLLSNVTDPKVTIAVAGAAANGSFTIPKKGDAVAVTVTVTVLGVGTDPISSGEIFADLGDRVVGIARLMVRARKVTPNVSFDPAATVLGRITNPFDNTSVDVQFSIQENAGQDLSFPNIALVSFNHKEWGGPGTKDVQAGHTFKPPKLPVEVPRLQTAPVSFEIAGLEAPGLYEGTLRLSGPNTKPIPVKLSVAVRYHWWIALALIFLGVMASHYLRRWLMQRRPKLVAQHRLAALRDELDRLLAALEPNSDESKIFASLRTDLRDLFVRAGAAEDVKAGTEEIERKLPVLARVVALRREIEKAGADQLLSELQPIWLWLRRPGTTAEEQRAQIKALEAIEISLDSEIADQRAVAGVAASNELSRLPPLEVTIPAERDLAEELRRGERWVTFVLLLVALVLGLRLLYVGSMTWGHPLDLFVAVLWGLGLHQVTSATAFGGIAGLRAQFSA